VMSSAPNADGPFCYMAGGLSDRISPSDGK
jgi:hypothetical protein